MATVRKSFGLPWLLCLAGPVLSCDRCGETLEIQVPILIGNISVLIADFIDRHRRCTPRGPVT